MKSAVFVLVQFMMIILIAIYAGVRGNIIQSSIMLVGLSLGIWAIVTMKLSVNVFPDVRENQKLFTSGPYKYIRHPMYTSVLLVTLAWTLNRVDAVSVCMLVILLVVLIQKLKYEEKLLSAKFTDYKNYMKKTKRLIPMIY